jgi:hypothetical protein
MFKEIEVTKYVVELTMQDGAQPIGFQVFKERSDARAWAEDVITKNKAEGIRAFIREYNAKEVVYDATTDRQVSVDAPSSVQ